MLTTGETPMSAITSVWARVETEAPVTRAVECDKVYRREEEFRSALNNYMAGYIAAQQKRCAAATGSIGSAARNNYFTVFWRFAGWIRKRSPFARTSPRIRVTLRASMSEMKRAMR
jgi:hypothetical protein